MLELGHDSDGHAAGRRFGWKEETVDIAGPEAVQGHSGCEMEVMEENVEVPEVEGYGERF